MRRWLLALWRALLVLLALEVCVYAAAESMAGLYRRAVWRDFNRMVLEHREVSGVPFAAQINRYAREYGINPEVVASVVEAESSFNPRALSPAGAAGLMQVIPGTWKLVNDEIKACSGRHAGECGPECYYDPELNLRIGTAYLAKMYKELAGDMTLAVAAYNAGPGAVKAHSGIPPYRESEDYVKRVIANWHKIKNTQASFFGGPATQWERIRTGAGWSFFATLVSLVFVARSLYLRNKSWRWR